MLLRRVLTRAAPVACRAAGGRAISHLTGRPPVVNTDAGTVAAFYYKNIRETDLPARDHLVAAGQDQRFTVEQWDKQVFSYAMGMLESLGLKKGSKIAVWMTNELEHLVVRYAAGLLGVTVVSVDAAASWADVKAVIAAEGVRSLIFSPRYGSENRFGTAFEEFSAELLPIAARGEGYEPFDSKRFRSLKHLVCTSLEFEDGIMRFRDLIVRGDNGSYETDDVAGLQQFLSKADTLFVPYSAPAAAGGAPTRGAAATHEDILRTAAASASAAGMRSTDVVLVTAPIGSHFGFAAGALAAAGARAKLVVPGKAFEAKAALAAAAEQGATVLVATPEQVQELAAAAAEDKAGAAAVAGLRSGVLPAGSKPATLGKAALATL